MRKKSYSKFKMAWLEDESRFFAYLIRSETTTVTFISLIDMCVPLFWAKFKFDGGASSEF
jgi:hypothetical protein